MGKLWVGADSIQKMAVVTVAVDGVSRPIAVPWRNKDVFEMMVDAVVRASRGWMQGLELK